MANAAFKENNDIKEEMAYLMVVMIVNERGSQRRYQLEHQHRYHDHDSDGHSDELDLKRDCGADFGLARTVVIAVSDSSMCRTP